MTLDIGADVSRETMDRLQAFADLTQKWTVRINLISKSTIDDIWHRHMWDSAQIYQYAPDFTHWVDIGSGGGFPGVVMATLARDLNPDARFTLIESDTRKATFLRTAARDLDLRLKVISKRIEQVEPQTADVVSARALGRMPDLLPLTQRHLAPSGTALLMKGRRYAEELHNVSEDWTYTLTEYPSITNEHSRILAIKGISRVS